MKKIIMLIGLACASSGCTTGPMGSIGPCSYYYGKHVDTISYAKAERMAVSVPKEKRAQVFQARALGMNEKEVAFAVGLDLLAAKEAIAQQQYKWYEYLGQFLCAAGDSAIYGGVGYASYKGIQTLTQNRDSNSGSGSINNYGVIDHATIIQQQNNTAPTSVILHSQNTSSKE